MSERLKKVSAGALAGEDWQVPSHRFAGMRRVQAIAVTAVVAGLVVALTLVAVFLGRQPVLPEGIGVLAATLVAGLVGERLLQRRVRAWAYCEREDDLLIKRGVLISRVSVVPYGRMQFIDVVSGPVERVFGLATVRMHTAAAASGARIPGLSADSAAILRDHLAALGESRLTGL